MNRLFALFALAMFCGCDPGRPPATTAPPSNGPANPPTTSVAPVAAVPIAPSATASTTEPQPSPANAATAQATDELAGRWKIVSLLKNGQEAIGPNGPTIEIQFANGRQIMSQNGQVLDDSGYMLDPTTTPKSIDTIHGAGGGKTASTLGIYEVNQDEARLCMGSGQARPKEFASTANYNVTVLKRVAP